VEFVVIFLIFKNKYGVPDAKKEERERSRQG
jgi:hypothetical protein